MSLRSIIKTSEKYIVDNAPTIVSAVAVSGTLATAFLTGRATFAAADRIREAQENENLQELGHELTTKEQIKLVWPLYVPPAIAVVGTVGCIVTANSLSAKRIAALAAAYKISEDHFEEYRDKVKEKLGLKEEEEMQAQIDQRKVDETYTDGISRLGYTPVVNGDVLFRDDWTGRYFYSSYAKVKSVENDINQMIMKDGYATLTDFYDGIGLEEVRESSQIGWSLEKGFSLKFTSALAEEGSIPVAVMHFGSRPHFGQDFDRMQ